MRSTMRAVWGGLLIPFLFAAHGPIHAAEHVTLKNGFEIDCARREALASGRMRLFILPSVANAGPSNGDANFIDVASDAVLGVEAFPDPVTDPNTAKKTESSSTQLTTTKLTIAELTTAEMHTILARVGTQHHIDEDLLASVVKAESGGRVMAISRTGARGLMQLMPGTASQMGVRDAFRPEQNIEGGTAYLDQLLVRYHDNAVLALAAYNAGPAAVDKYHGLPPYLETRAYVARVIREFNRRKTQAAAQARVLAAIQTAGLAR